MPHFYRSRIPVLLTGSFLTAAALVSGCEEPKTRVYSVPKETPPSAPSVQQATTLPNPSPSASASQPPSVATPSWHVPAGWVASENQHSLRVATFSAGAPDAGIEIIVSQFPGDVGGLLANVNRWRQQIGLAPLTEEQLPQEVAAFENGAFDGHVMRLKGTDQHMLAASIYDNAADRTWFVKATAAPSIADQHEQAFFEFARSFGSPSVEKTE